MNGTLSGLHAAMLAATMQWNATVPPIPDVGTIRYRDPPGGRAVWLGLDAGGVGLPRSATPYQRRVWLVRVEPAWAIGLIDRLAVGGRHGLTWYDAENIRLRVHSHQLELSAHAIQRPRMHDRITLGYEMHELKLSVVEDVRFKIGGVRDDILTLAYGIEHDLGRAFTLAWQIQGRHAWVMLDTQRQLRGSVRAAWRPWPGHRLALSLVGYYVHRNRDQAGAPLPRHGAYAQVVGEYAWMSRRHVGFVIAARYANSFLSGEAPMFEIREESLNAHFGEAWLGVRAEWP